MDLATKIQMAMRFIIAFSLVVITAFVFMFVFVNPVVINYSKAKVEGITVKAVNKSISSIVSADTYKNLVDIRYDSAGKITSLTTNMLQMNGLASDVALKGQKEIEHISQLGIAVPLGTFSGLPILTGKGPDVVLRVVPVGSINCTFSSDFSEAGFNQTRHRIVLKVRSKVNLIMPLVTHRVEAEVDVMLCESIIIGEVPAFLWTK